MSSVLIFMRIVIISKVVVSKVIISVVVVSFLHDIWLQLQNTMMSQPFHCGSTSLYLLCSALKIVEQIELSTIFHRPLPFLSYAVGIFFSTNCVDRPNWHFLIEIFSSFFWNIFVTYFLINFCQKMKKVPPATRALTIKLFYY